MIFVSSFTTNGPRNIGMYAFDERTGKKLWSARSPGQSEFSSPPTAASGTVYTAAAGDGGTMYAYDEATGALKWTAPVENGDDSSPAVTSSGVYVSYACPQTYDLGPSNGQVIWHYSGPCEGGGGSTPVLYDGLLFVEDSQVSSTYDGLILNATNGAAAGRFNAEFPPAFTLQLGFFVNPKTLVARTIPKMKRVWSVRLSGHDKYNAPPLVVGNVVYTTTIANTLIGYDVGTGKQKILQKMVNSTNFNDAIAGLGFGDGELVVPDGPYLIAFGGS
jgi:outer membrane protein assembly factor BamB